MSRAAILLASASLMVIPTTGPSAQDGRLKPVHESRFFVDGGTPPTSLRDLWKRSDAVIEGVVDRLVPSPEGAESNDQLPTTRLEIRVVRVFKADAHAPQTCQQVSLVMWGVVRDRGTHLDIVQDRQIPLLERGQHPILFLKWSETETAFVPTTGTSDSIFVLEGDSVSSHGRSNTARELAKTPSAELVTRLRNLGRVE